MDNIVFVQNPKKKKKKKEKKRMKWGKPRHMILAVCSFYIVTYASFISFFFFLTYKYKFD